MQQQGIQVNENEISDEMLYGQIAANADLRASITTVLRARGYVSDDESPVFIIELYGAGWQRSDVAYSNALNCRMTGAVATGNDAGSRVSEGLAGVDGSGTSATVAESMRSNRSRQSQLENPRGQEKANASS